MEHTPRQLELLAQERRKVDAGRMAQLAHLVAAASHAGFMGGDGQGPLRSLVRELETICGGD